MKYTLISMGIKKTNKTVRVYFLAREYKSIVHKITNNTDPNAMMSI